MQGCKEQQGRHSTRTGGGTTTVVPNREDGVADKGSMPQQGAAGLSVRMQVEGCEMPGGTQQREYEFGGAGQHPATGDVITGTGAAYGTKACEWG